MPAGAVPQAVYSFPAEQEAKPNPWINTSFALIPTPKSEPRKWYRVKKLFQSFWWIQSKLWILTASEGYHFYSLDLKSYSWVHFCFQPRLILTSCFNIQRNKRGQPYPLDCSFWGGAVIAAPPAPSFFEQAPAVHAWSKVRARSATPAPRMFPGKTLTTMRCQCGRVPCDTGGALPSLQASCSPISFVPSSH